MAITVKHTKVSTIPDTDDTSLVRPSDWNADHTLVGTIDVANGGTGASTLTGYVKGNGTSAMTAVATVPSTDITGLGTMSTQNANAVAITGGTITGVSGLVTSVTGTSPVVSSGGTTPAISMPAATGSVNGYLTSADWTTFNGKGSGTVTSVAATVPSFLSVTGSPITSSGTLALTYSGTALPVANGGTGASTLTGLVVGNGTSAMTTVTAPSGTVVGTTDTQTLTNKRINPRVSSTTSTATLTVNSDSFDQAVLTAQAVALSVAAPTGTPVNGQKLTLRFKDNATAQTISWTTTSGGFRVIGCTLPTTTVISKTVYIGCIYNSDDTFWDVVSVGQQI